MTGGPWVGWVVTLCCDSLIWCQEPLLFLAFCRCYSSCRACLSYSPISLGTLILQGQLYLGSPLLMLIFVAGFLLMVVRLSNCSHGMSTTKATPTLPPIPSRLSHWWKVSPMLGLPVASSSTSHGSLWSSQIVW